MSEIPFGFGKSDDDDPSSSGGSGGAAGSGGSTGFGGFGFGPGGPADLGSALHRFADLMSWQGGPVNWDLAKDLARQAAAGDDPSVGAPERAAVLDSLRLADLWLDAATTFPVVDDSRAAWSRAEWIESTMPGWTELVEPVAAKVVEAFSAQFGNLGELPGVLGLPGLESAADESADPTAELGAFAGPLLSMMRQMGGLMFGGQVGQALGSLSREVVSSTDVGLPLAGTGHLALVPAGVSAFGAGLGLPPDEVRLFVALREAACHRLYHNAPWLRSRLIAAVEDYARGITVDTARLQEALGTVDPTNPESLQQALTEGLFEPQTTPAQQLTLTRLETLLALIEGWIDDVVGQACAGRLPGAEALAETVRRRRAAGGPAEQTFATLVGLELRPRRMREAAALWRRLRETRGIDGRDAIWGHPDLLPGTDDLDDPEGFAGRRDLEVDLDLSSLGDDSAPDDDR